jgi:hypothetical protein
LQKTMIALAAAALLAPGMATADGAAPFAPGPDGVKVAFTEPGTRTLTIRLDAGRDYAVATIGGGDGRVVVRDAGGRTLAVAPISGSDTFGASFHAPYSGAYFVDVTDQSVPAGTTDYEFVAIDRDCAAGQHTRCALPAGSTSTVEGFNYEDDKDWWATSLRGGRTYDAHLELAGHQGEFVFLRVLDARRHAIVPWACTDDTTNGTCDLTFRAPRDGTYYILAAWGGAPSPSPYSISLTAR